MKRSRHIFLRGMGVGLAGLLAACAQVGTNRQKPSSRQPLTPTPASPVLVGVEDLTQVARLIGAEGINDTERKWDVTGTDLGSMFDKDGKIYIAFGDTFGPEKQDWRCSVMAVTSDRDPRDGLTFDEMLTDRPGHARELLPRGLGDVTVIPTYGVAVGRTMVLHYMAVKHWGDPGMWDLNEAGLATSEDDGQTWVKDTPVKWPGDTNFGQVALVKEGKYLYLFGIPGGRFGGVKLARVPQEQFLDPAKYEYFTGLVGKKPQWAADEASGILVVPAPVGELSVMWNEYLGRWIMTYLDDQMNNIMIREAPELWGAWGPALKLVSGSQYSGLYGAYLHPWYVENKGETIYFNMSLWGPYAVYLMKARLQRG